MNNYSDQDLKAIYRECLYVQQTQKAQGNTLLLRTYNELYRADEGFLHYWMMQEVFKKVSVEMAERFYNQ